MKNYHPLRFIPSDTIEKSIVSIWRNILEHLPLDFNICLDDRFDDLGANQTNMQYMLLEVSNQFNHYLPDLNTFQSFPTLRSLAFQVKCAEFEAPFHSAIWLNGKSEFLANPNSHKFPVILIHSLAGDPVEDYKYMIKNWQQAFFDWPLLAIRMPSLDHPGYFAASLEKLAADYLHYLNQPVALSTYEGPLVLIGYSAGGAIAYEMAKQLLNKNRPVALCCLDTTGPDYYQNLTASSFASEIYFAMKYMCLLLNIEEGNITEAQLQQIPKESQLEKYWENLLTLLAKKNYSQKEYEKLIGVYAMLETIIQGYLKYKVVPLDNLSFNPFLISFSDTRMKLQNSEYLGWGKSLSFKPVLLPGGHFELMTSESWFLENLLPVMKTFIKKVSGTFAVTPEPIR